MRRDRERLGTLIERRLRELDLDPPTCRDLAGALEVPYEQVRAAASNS